MPPKRAGGTRGEGKAARKRAKQAARSERDARADLFDRLSGEMPYLGVKAAGASFVVATNDAQVGRSLFVKGVRPEMGVLGRAVRLVEALAGEDALAGTTFVDVGANIGTTTVTALVEHGFGSAVACEPNEDNQRVLRANLALNGLDDRVHPVRAAASDRTGRGKLVVTAGKGGISWIALDPARVEPDRIRKARRAGRPLSELPEWSFADVELVTLDGLAEAGVLHPERVGMLWVDAEGHEGQVLAGASALARRGVPIVLEYHPTSLDLRGDREKVHEVAQGSYTHFSDIRRAESDGGRARPSLQPVGELADYGERFMSPSGETMFTDLLLLRLDADEASAFR